MNETFDTFNTSIIEAFESNYLALQRELDQLNEKRRRVELLREMQKTKTVKIAEFFEIIFTMSINRNEIDDFQKKIFFKIVNFKKYESITQYDLNIFIRECNEMFEIRRNIYANDKNKIFLAKSFFDDVSTKDWKRHQKTIDLSAISLFEFIDFLQKHLNFKHFKLLEINAKLKKIRQWNEQSIVNLIVYLNNLKIQMSEKLSNYQKYFNLMKILHFYLKIAIIRRINVIVLWVELKKSLVWRKKSNRYRIISKRLKIRTHSKTSNNMNFNFIIKSIDSILTRYKTQFRIMIETTIATKKIIKNATKKIVMINSTTTRIDFKWCVEIAKNAIITITIVKNHFKTIKIFKIIKTIKTREKFKINRRNLCRTNSNESRRDR